MGNRLTKEQLGFRGFIIFCLVIPFGMITLALVLGIFASCRLVSRFFKSRNED